MPEVQCSVKYGDKDIRFRLIYSKRRSLEISVHPNGAVAVKAPLGTDEDTVMHRVRKRARWIKKQMDHFAQFEPRTPERKFVGGESHLYLGKKYRLKIRQSETEEVLLKHGYFYITATDGGPVRVANLLDAWYRRKAKVCFAEILEDCWGKYYFSGKGVSKPALKIRAMKTRWGSLSKKSGMTLNLELIKAPKGCIEYVIVHELCHLHHPNHGKAFYGLLESVLPDWKKRKHALEMTLA